MSNEMSVTEANAVLQMSRILKSKGAYERFAASLPSVALDWLLEQGYVTTGTTNASARAYSGKLAQSNAYATKTGRTWFHATPGPGVAILVAARALKASTQVLEMYARVAAGL